MNTPQKTSLFLLRITLGWLFFYAGFSKLINPNWSAAGYLKNAKSLTGLYEFFASPSLLPVTNFLNEWGLTLVGAALLLGIAVRLAAWAGIILMALYYFPILIFPKVGANAFLVDEHVIFAITLALLAAFNAGSTWGLTPWLSKQGWAKHKFIQQLIL